MAEAEQIDEALGIFGEACITFSDSQRALEWLTLPSDIFGGQAPLAMLDSSDGRGAVRAQLARIEHGIFYEPTVHAFRLCRHDRAALDGAGGLYADGRWHPIGRRIAYAASSLSLAVLETRVHHDSAPRGWVVLELSIPDRLIETYDATALPADWANPSRHHATARSGIGWNPRGRPC